MRTFVFSPIVASFLTVYAKGQASDLFISEYCEGSSYNKYIEIFNGTGSSVDLSNYKVWKISNGGSWPEKELTLSGTLPNNDVYVVAHSSANSNILYKSDVTWGLANWNGDDAVGLAKDINGAWTLVDAVGADGNDPGTGWDVAGIGNATADHTLVRKPSVSQGNTDWPSSAGTDADNSEWIVHDNDTFDYLGSHTFSSGSTGNTTVQFLSSSMSVLEGAGTYDITVSVSNEDTWNETSVDVVLTTQGTATNSTDISPYSTQMVTFPAGSSTNQIVTITLTDDSHFEGNETLAFELQNATGGNSASIGSPSQLTVIILDNDAPNILINEILADPPADDEGDANRDGTGHTSQDEFVELVNHHGSDVNIGGWTISDNTKVRHVFSDSTILPNGDAIVVFGGGTPAGSFGNTLVQTASTGSLGLNNSGDNVILKASNGASVASHTYGSEAGNDQSITRSPDITGLFVRHSEASGANGALYSPGTKLNGRPFTGVTINESSGGTAVTEGGATDSYTMKLESQPTSDVAITISPDNQTAVSATSLTFTTSNYSTAQTVTVSAVDDGDIEGNHTSIISHTASSSDTRYNGISIDNLTVTITDNDVAGVTITESGGSTDVTEGGSTDTCTIALASTPTADVAIAISVSDWEVSVDPPSLTFTSSNFSTAQIVALTAVDDNDYEGTHSSTITHTASSSDANYNGISIGNVTVSITDNDAPNIVINEIHYNPGGSDDLYEFLELYNGEGRSIDISGFSFTSGISCTFGSNTFIDAEQYVVVAKTSTTYSGGGYPVFQWSGGLTNSGETVEISTASSGGIVVDSVTYGNASPWPTGTNGNGPSLELVNPGLDNSLGASWKASTSFNGTPGSQNSIYDADPAPIIYNISRSVSVPTSLQDVTVTAKVVENSSVKLAQLVYYVNDASETVTNMTGDGTTYTGLIPSNVFGDGHRVKYIIRVTDDASQMSTSDTSAFFAGTTPISSLHPVNVSGELLYSGYHARVTGVATVASGVFSTSDLDVYVQDTTGGINLYKSGAIPTPIIEGNRYTVEGSLGQYRGQTRIVPDDALTDIVDNGAGIPISSAVKTVAQLLSNPELYEGTKIKIENLTKTSTSTDWPEPGSSKTLQVTDSGGEHSVHMFIDEDTDIDDVTEPLYPVDVAGVLSQSDPGSPYNSSYRIMPRAYSDISGNQSPTSVGFATTSATVNENGGSTTLTVSISNPSSVLETSVDIVLKSGNAGDIGNFTTQTVTFPAGSSVEQIVSITITDNSEYEDNRSVQFVLRNLSGEYGATIDVDSIFTLSIQEDDPQPKTVVQFTSISATVNEGDGTIALLLSIIAPSSTDSTSVEVVLIGGTGDSTDIDNYPNQSVTFPSGNSDNQSVLLRLTDDPYYEGDETLVLTLRNITGGHSSVIGNDSTFTLTIEENDLQTSVQFSTIRATLVEGTDNTIALTVAITNPFDLAVTTVDVVLISGNPKDVGDYTTQTLIFPPGSSDSQFVTLTITDDDIVEQNDTLVLDLQNASGGNATTVGMNSQFTLIIQDRDIYSIIINEIHYNPGSAQGSDDDYEFMELYNAGTATAHLEGHTFTYGIEYIFTMADSIQAGDYFVLAKNAVTYPGSIQWTSNGLRNSGEDIVIVNQAGFIVDSLNYDDAVPWPTEPNGGGPSLELIDPSLDNSIPGNWLASFVDGGTPGASNSSNSAPLAVADTYNVNEDDTLTVVSPGVLANDTDADNHTLTAKLNSDVSQGTLSLKGDGSFTYIPDANRNGTDSFSYVANDSWGDSDPAAVTITISPVNDPPVVANPIDDVTVDEDTDHSLIDLTGVFIDVDISTNSDDLKFSFSNGNPILLDVNLDTMTLNLVYLHDQYGVATIIVTASDDSSASVTDTFMVVVNPVDDPPAVVNPFPDISVNEDAPDTILGSLRNVFEDVDDTLNFNHTNSNTGLVQVSINNDVVTLHFLSDANGTAELVFTASNIGSPVSVKDTVLIVVNPLNDAPHVTHLLPDVSIDEDLFSFVVITKLEQFFDDKDEGDHLMFTGEALDEGLDSLNISQKEGDDYVTMNGTRLNSTRRGNRSYEVTSNNAGTGITTDSTALTVYPRMNFSGKVRITITAVDDSSASISDTLELTIMPLNDPPIITEIPDISINEDDTLALILSAYDMDGDTLTFSAIGDTDAVLATVTDTILTLIPAQNWYGRANITITVADQLVNVSDQFVLMVLPVNDVPAVFKLLQPADNAIITITDDNLIDTMWISWQKAIDVDGDKVLYSVKLSGGLSILTIGETADTTMSLDYAGLAALMHGQELPIITGSWTIIASDGKLTTEANNGPFTLTIDAGGLGVGEVRLIPQIFVLHQNHPNPFNPVTSIRYDIPEIVDVRIEIYNLLGQKVRTLVASRHQPGFYHTVWNGRNDDGVSVTTGVYVYRILATDPASGETIFTKTQKLVLIK